MTDRALVLIVCSGNICRSPMAEHILRRLIGRAGDSQRLRVASAGTWAPADQPAACYARRVLKEEGLDLSEHRSRRLAQQDVDEASLVLVMEKGHKESILMRFPGAETRPIC